MPKTGRKIIPSRLDHEGSARLRTVLENYFHGEQVWSSDTDQVDELFGRITQHVIPLPAPLPHAGPRESGGKYVCGHVFIDADCNSAELDAHSEGAWTNVRLALVKALNTDRAVRFGKQLKEEQAKNERIAQEMDRIAHVYSIDIQTVTEGMDAVIRQLAISNLEKEDHV